MIVDDPAVAFYKLGPVAVVIVFIGLGIVTVDAAAIFVRKTPFDPPPVVIVFEMRGVMVGIGNRVNQCAARIRADHVLLVQRRADRSFFFQNLIKHVIGVVGDTIRTVCTRGADGAGVRGQVVHGQSAEIHPYRLAQNPALFIITVLGD